MINDDINNSNSNSNSNIPTNNILEQLKEVKKLFSDPSLYLPVFFIFCWQATPSAGNAMFYFTTNELKFAPEFLGRTQLLGTIASLVGVISYRQYFKDNFSMKDLIRWTTLASIPVSLTQLLLTTHVNRQLGYHLFIYFFNFSYNYF